MGSPARLGGARVRVTSGQWTARGRGHSAEKSRPASGWRGRLLHEQLHEAPQLRRDAPFGNCGLISRSGRSSGQVCRLVPLQSLFGHLTDVLLRGAAVARLVWRANAHETRACQQLERSGKLTSELNATALGRSGMVHGSESVWATALGTEVEDCLVGVRCQGTRHSASSPWRPQNAIACGEEGTGG